MLIVIQFRGSSKINKIRLFRCVFAWNERIWQKKVSLCPVNEILIKVDDYWDYREMCHRMRSIIVLFHMDFHAKLSSLSLSSAKGRTTSIIVVVEVKKICDVDSEVYRLVLIDYAAPNKKIYPIRLELNCLA